MLWQGARQSHGGPGNECPGVPPYPLGGELQADDGGGILWAEHGQELRMHGAT